jgi:hypothetical protein
LQTTQLFLVVSSSFHNRQGVKRMSHIEEGKTNLVFADLPALLDHPEALAQHPAMKLMRQAAALVARQYGGEIKPYYCNYWGQEQQANTGLALHIPPRSDKTYGQALPRGIGLVVDPQTGALKFRGDPWGVDQHFYAQVQKQMIQKYTALSHAAVLRQMGYQVALQEEANQIQITGVAYA